MMGEYGQQKAAGGLGNEEERKGVCVLWGLLIRMVKHARLDGTATAGR